MKPFLKTLLLGSALVTSPCGCGQSGQLSWKSKRADCAGPAPVSPGEALLEERRQVAIAAITAPDDGATVGDRAEVDGRITHLPTGVRLYLALSDRFENVYLQYPGCRPILPGEHSTFRHRNVRLAGAETEFRILLLSCPPQAAAELEAHARRQNWGAISLPATATVIDEVAVRRR